MNYRKNIITYFIVSIVLVILAILFQIFLTQKISAFIVPILIGAATGIVATMIACILDNNQKLQKEILIFERTVCHILGALYKIAKLDVKQNITNEVNNYVFEICDYYEDLQNVAKKIDLLFITQVREKKLKEIFEQLEQINIFLLYEFKPLNNIKNAKFNNYEEIALFEALKVIKFARKYNPQPVLNIIQKSKNNKPSTINGREELVNIIFERDIFNNEMKRKCDKIMKEEIKSLYDLYNSYDINKVISAVDKIQLGDWSFSTKISWKDKRIIKKMNKIEN